MRIQIIVPEHISNEIREVKTNHLVNYVILSGEEYILIKDKQNFSIIYCLDFHSITNALLDFEPDIVLIIPFVHSEIDMSIFQFTEEYLEALTTEFIAHLCESNAIIKSKLVLAKLSPWNVNFTSKLESSYQVMTSSTFGSLLSIKNYPTDIISWITTI